MPSKIPVIWYEGSGDPDNRSHYADAGLINETFDALADYEFMHCNTWSQFPEDFDGAVVILHGGHLAGYEDSILYKVNTLKWSVVVVFCDDESTFNTRLFQAPNRKLWQQMPIPGVHDFCDRFLICGYPCDARREIAKSEGIYKDLDWFFSGQITHSRRHHCVKFLQKLPNGVLNKTEGFYQGYPRAEYYEYMLRAKVHPCPAGPVTADTIRVAESLECGGIPIADDKPGNRSDFPLGYWRYVLKQEPPFPVLTEWSLLPETMERELAAFPEKTFKLQKWWKGYKASMQDWLREDIEELRGRCE